MILVFYGRHITNICEYFQSIIVYELCSSEFKLTFITASALLGMCSIYIGQLVRAAAAPLILRMRACIGGVACA